MSGRKTTVNWTERETELLLKTIKGYKDTSTEAGYDWTTLRARYDKIKENFITAYQQVQVFDEANFPNKDNLSMFTKSIVVNKIKRLRSSFRDVSFKGKKSSRGSTVSTYYALCEEICPDIACESAPTSPSSPP